MRSLDNDPRLAKVAHGVILRLEPVPAAHIEEVAVGMCRVARRIGVIVECEHDGRPMSAYPNDMPGDVVLRAQHLVANGFVASQSGTKP